MATYEPLPEPAGIKLDDIIFLVLSHKWKLIFGTLLGLVAAAIVYTTHVAEYESEAKLLVRYVVEKSAVDASDAQQRPGGAYGDTLLAAEVEILTSWDLIQEVADAVVAENLLPSKGKPVTAAEAASVVQGGLHVLVNAAKSNVITVSFRHRDPEVARAVLSKIVNTYFEKHLQAHRPAESVDLVNTQADKLRTRLSGTETKLKEKKSGAGIISLEQARSTFDGRLSALQSELDSAEAQLAEQQARVAALEKASAGTEPSSQKTAIAVTPPPQEADLQRYRALLTELSDLDKSRKVLEATYTRGSRIVQVNREQSAEVEAELKALEKKSPGLVTAAPIPAGGSSQATQTDLTSEQLKQVGIQAKVDTLRKQMAALKDSAQRFSDAEIEISQLERSKNADEKNYQYFQLSLEKARVDVLLDPSKMPNISVVQSPSPAMKMSRDMRKVLYGIVGGGIALGVALVLLTEFVLDPSVKRSVELQARMGIPLLHSIPRAREEGVLKLIGTSDGGGAGGSKEIVAEAPRKTELRSYLEAVRDRLILYFELNNLFHTPKLVAVAGCSQGVGTSSIAGGLAAALAETGDGKVLLVDMNRSQSNHPLFNGKPVSTVTEALRSGTEIQSVSDNLYLATVAPQEGEAVQLVPRRFYEMVPHFKASVYDYIVFDMPPLDESCAALAIAGSVDKVLLVVEAGRTHREVVRRAYGDLLGAKANVSCILNKTEPVGPARLKKAS